MKDRKLCFLYHKEKGSQLFPISEVPAMLQDGWYDTPNFTTHEVKEENKGLVEQDIVEEAKPSEKKKIDLEEMVILQNETIGGIMSYIYRHSDILQVEHLKELIRLEEKSDTRRSGLIKDIKHFIREKE